MVKQKRKAVKVIYISTYIPQKCGIATFTKDVTTAINLLNPRALAEIMPIIKDNEDPHFPWEVKHKIIQSNLISYLEAANYINNSSCDLVLIEHEFGIFGGKCGDYLNTFLEAVKKPKVMTCHTIIDDPKNEWGQVFQKLVKNVDGLTIMTSNSAKKLTTLYGVNKNKIIVIPHGTPDLSFNSTEIYKKRKKLSGRIVLGNINLLSENKGIDYAIEAVAEIAKKYPQVLYLVIGQTHPNVLENDGEKYRNFLKQKIKKLGIKNNVRFINHYLSLGELIEWLKAIDIYITPYLDPQQSSSGALAYAVGAGKPCISTNYLYAQEILANGRGILVPFRDSKAIAEAVIDLWENQVKRKQIEKRAYKYGRFMTWTSVGIQHLDFFAEIIKKHGSKYQKTN
jgi:polysaccharide biosynthesis protein PslF